MAQRFSKGLPVPKRFDRANAELENILAESRLGLLVIPFHLHR